MIRTLFATMALLAALSSAYAADQKLVKKVAEGIKYLPLDSNGHDARTANGKYFDLDYSQRENKLSIRIYPGKPPRDGLWKDVVVITDYGLTGIVGKGSIGWLKKDSRGFTTMLWRNVYVGACHPSGSNPCDAGADIELAKAYQRTYDSVIPELAAIVEKNK